MKDTYNSALGYLGKSCGTQTIEESHQKFLNLALKVKLGKPVRFVCYREKGGVLKPEELGADFMVTINETVTLVFEG